VFSGGPGGPQSSSSLRPPELIDLCITTGDIGARLGAILPGREPN
jgi:hypothetical protein